MIFLQLWWTLLVLTGTGTGTGTGTANKVQPQSEPPATGSAQLRNFHSSLEEARAHLDEIRANYGQVEGAETFRHRRNSIDDLLESFAQAGDKQVPAGKDDKEDKALQQAADDWFRDFRTDAKGQGAAEEPPVGGKYSRSTCRGKPKMYVNNYAKALEQTELGKVKKKYKDASDDNSVMSVYTLPERQPIELPKGGATELDIKLKHMQQQLNTQDLERNRDKQGKPGKDNDPLTQYGENNVPDGVYEQTLARLQFSRLGANNLSHEANYKLSKIEQEAAEQNAKRRYPSGLKKRSSANGFNPMNEIKLKTSNRLMRKGMGPSLPSNALTDTLRAHYVDDMLMRRERKLERERQKQQLKQQEGDEDKNALISRYDALGATLDKGNVDSAHLLETPQSYDYHLPHFDQFHALSQRSQVPNLRDYAHANARLKMDRDRFKRMEPESEAQLQEAAKLPDAEELVAKLAAPSPAAVAAEQLKQAPKTELKTAQVVAVKEETQPQEQPLDKTEPALKSPEQQLANESKQQQSGQSPQSQLAAKQKDDNLQKPSGGKLKREETRLALAELAPRSALCKSHPDAVVKLLATKISQHAGVKDRDKRWTWHRIHRQKNGRNAASELSHLKRRSKRSLEQQPETTGQDLQSDSHMSSKDQPQLEAQTQAEPQSEGVQVGAKAQSQLELQSQSGQLEPQVQPQPAGLSQTTAHSDPESQLDEKKLPLDSFEDHNGNRVRFGKDLRLELEEAEPQSELEPQTDAQVSPKAQTQSEPQSGQLEPQVQPQLADPSQSTAHSDQDSQLEEKKLPLDSFEDHNVNRVRFGKDLTLEQEESEGDVLLSNLKDEEMAVVDSNVFSNSRYQVPMMSQRVPQQSFGQQHQLQQHQLQQQQLQQQQQQLQLQQCQPQVVQRQQPQQQQQFQQQLQQQADNLKASYNLTHLFNELAKLQKLPQQQQQQELQQQLQLQQQQQQQHSNVDANQLKTLYGVHRYFGPLFNKASKLNMISDPCASSTTAATTAATTEAPTTATTATPTATPTAAPTSTAATTAASTGSTINPDCVLIPTETAASSDILKLNVSLNAKVCSDPKTKKLFGNGTIIVQPSGQQRLNADAYYVLQDALVDEADVDVDADSEERYSRQARLRNDNDNSDNSENDNSNSNISNSNSNSSGSNNSNSSSSKRGKAGRKDKAGGRQKGAKSGEKGKMKIKEPAKGSGEAGGESGGHRKLDLDDDYSESYGKLITGKLSEEIVNAVYDMVSNDPSLDMLITVLARNRKSALKRPKNFYQIRNNHNEKKLLQAEQMVRNTMETISAMIDKQMQQRNCIPLRPDLVEFYNVIMKTMAEQQKIRDKRQASLRLFADDFSQEAQLLDPASIEQKSRIVKKLLRQYEELPLEEQQHASNVRDELLMDLVYLRKMSDTLERSQRNAELQGVLRQSSEAVEDPQLYEEYTPRFIKLLKTAEIFKEVGEQQARAFVGL